MRSLPRTAAGAVLVLSVALGAAACSNDEADPTQNEKADTDDSGEVTPEEVLSFAKDELDATSGVSLRISTDDNPDVDPFLQSAEGVVTRAPAFEGEATGTFSGFTDTVAVRSVDNVFYAELPLVGWRELDPTDLCAPDPATLLASDGGVSEILTSAEDVEAGEAGRADSDGEVTGTRYTGTVPGEAVKNVLPCAPGDSFDATFLVSGDGQLREAVMTGEFFEGAGELTYTIFISEYDVEQEIVAP